MLFLGLFLWSCEGNRTAENTEEITVDVPEQTDTARVERTGRTVDERLESLRGWMNEKVEKGDTAIKREMPEIKEDFRRRSAEIEQNLDSLSADSKAEYARLRQRYERWESRQERRQNTPLDAAELRQWRELLLREFNEVEAISPQNVREAYLTFMGVVRAKRQNWTQSDWDYVDNVYGQLNQRRRQIEGQMSNSDKLKVRALQAEYLTLEGAADTRSLLQNMRN
ncbi:hypothetical protein H9Q13_00270 [Pontibacter sp. JH31]|uniref:DUF6565 domain-containing protein n=2 Tax=Pontibacter aquaedesilientis TaxID=2766980 RepID=A0ABR7XBA3_9BACT|nr:hypothetical protein [Pontibacter aquaedesilientis]